MSKILLQALRFLEPQRGYGIGRHTPVAARRKRYGTDLRAVRQAGALELLRKEAAHKGRQPLFDGRVVIHARKGLVRGTEDLARRIAEAQHIIQEKVVQLIRADQVFRLLCDLAVLCGQQFGGDGGVEDVQQHLFQGRGGRWRRRIRPRRRILRPQRWHSCSRR